VTPSAVDARAAVIDAENPWPGLLAFAEEAHPFFHGRDRESDEFVRMIRRHPLSVLFGLSGLGKTSLLRAGVFPRLRRDGWLPIYIRLDPVDVVDLVDQVRRQVSEAVVDEAIDAPAPAPDVTLWEYFHRSDIEFWTPRNRLVEPVLCFDQFEEIFTLGAPDPARSARARALLEALAELIEGRLPPAVTAAIEADPDRVRAYDFSRQGCRVVFSFREDFLADFEGLRGQIPSVMRNRLRLGRFSVPEAIDVVTRSGGVLVDREVARRIALFVGGGSSDEAVCGGSPQEVEPSLLSVVCHELNLERRRTGSPRITADLLGGARAAILTSFYERCFTGLDPRIRLFVEDHLLTESGFRNSYARDDAVQRFGVPRADIELLVSRRLLRLEERCGTFRIELTHDVLTGIVRDSRDARRRRDEEMMRTVELRAAEERQRQAAEEARRREAAASRQLRRARKTVALLLFAALVAPVIAVYLGLDAYLFDRLTWVYGLLGAPARGYESSSVAVIVVDYATLESSEFRELPRALWSPAWAAVLDAVLTAGARAAGLGLALTHSARVISPDHDRTLIEVLGRHHARIVLGRTTRDPVADAYYFALDADEDAFGYLEISEDFDAVVRRIPSRFLIADGEAVPSLSGALLRRVGVAGPEVVYLGGPEHPSAVPTYSMIDVLRCGRVPGLLEAAFRDRVVLVGTALKREDEHLASTRFVRPPTEPRGASHPCGLKQATPEASRPEMVHGVFLHAAAVKAVIEGRLLTEAPAWVVWSIATIIGIICGSSSWLLIGRRALLVLVVAVAITVTAATVIRLFGVWLPPGTLGAMALAGSATGYAFRMVRLSAAPNADV